MNEHLLEFLLFLVESRENDNNVLTPLDEDIEHVFKQHGYLSERAALTGKGREALRLEGTDGRDH